MTKVHDTIQSKNWLQFTITAEIYIFPEDMDLLDFVSNKAKERVSNPVFQENKGRQVFWKTYFFVFLKHSFWDSPFCLITYDLEKIV